MTLIHVSSLAVPTERNTIGSVEISGHDADYACLRVKTIDLTWKLRVRTEVE